MKIYTKMGDGGETSLWGKAGEKRVAKDAVRVEAYGTVDEANAILGLLRTQSLGEAVQDMLAVVQHRLFALGADLSNINPDRPARIEAADVGRLEAWIDMLDQELTPLKAFILPGGSVGAGWLHQARTVTRRAERRVVSLLQEDDRYGVQLQYLNRLSDFLFVLARYQNQQEGIPDVKADF